MSISRLNFNRKSMNGLYNNVTYSRFPLPTVPSMNHWVSLLPDAAAIAIVQFVVTYAMAELFGRKRRLKTDASQVGASKLRSNSVQHFRPQALSKRLTTVYSHVHYRTHDDTTPSTSYKPKTKIQARKEYTFLIILHCTARLLKFDYNTFLFHWKKYSITANSRLLLVPCDMKSQVGRLHKHRTWTHTNQTHEWKMVYSASQKKYFK